MNIDDIAQYTHKIKKITINNKNTYSLYENVLLKISLDPSDVKEDEVVRFSTIEGEWLEHEQFDGDFYCYIPNKINSIYDIYAHFFPSQLYEYTPTQEIFSKYDFNELYEALQSNDSIPTTINSQTFQHQTHYFDGTKYVQNEDGTFEEVPEMYNIEANIKDYTTEIDDEGRLVVKAYSSDSVTKDFDPNYKNYITNGLNNTQKSIFPLASKYRTTQDWKVPDLNKSNPMWEEKNNNPFWEVRIGRIGLSPLITNKVYGKDLPINVMLNYEYLPTSREYHQHYYGFEPDWADIANASIPLEKCNLINVFEGTNVTRLDEAFGSKNNYRIINWGNPYDDSKSFYLDHSNVIPIELSYFNATSCNWNENLCYHYWVLKPTDNNPYCNKNITLKEDTYYTLKYYIYIPSKVQIETNQNNTCHITITSHKEYKLNDAFLKHDKDARNQWIYHEVPFKAAENNIIKIYGAPYIKDYNQSIYFMHMSIEEMVEYSPTLKYNNRSLIVSEQNENATKPLSDTPITETPCPKITPHNTKWTPTNTNELPIPYSDVNIVMENEKYVYYDPITTNIYYTHPKYVYDDNTVSEYNNTVIKKNELSGTPNYTTKYYKKNNNTMTLLNDANGATYKEEWDTNTGIELKHILNEDKDISVTYTDPSIKQTYTDFLTGIRGKGNKYTFYFQDTNGNFLNHGDVEIGIFETKDERADIETAKKFIIKKNINGVVIWENIDFSLKSLPYNSANLQLNPQGDPNQYYIRITYKDICTQEPKTIFKTLHIVDEKIHFGKACGNPTNEIVLINNPENRNDNIEIPAGTTYTIDDERQFPIRLRTYVMNNNNSGNCLNEGWCELFINEDQHQSTLVDKNGQADFYLNFSDLSKGKQTIKIEYYKQYNIPLAFTYFDIDLKDVEARDVVFVDFYRDLFSDTNPVKITEDTIYLADDDFLVFDIVPDPTKYEYNCEIWIDNEKYLSQNFYAKQDENNIQSIPIIIPETKNYNIKIITKDIVKANGEIYTNNGRGKFQRYEKELNVIVQ